MPNIFNVEPASEVAVGSGVDSDQLVYNQTPTYQGFKDNLAPGDWPVIEVQQGVPGGLRLAFPEDCKPEDSLETQTVTQFGEVARLIVKEHPSLPPLFNIDGQYVNSGFSNRYYEFTLTKSHVSKPGTYSADVVRYSDTDRKTPINVIRTYLEVDINNLNATPATPLSISEMRLILRDECPDQNYLLDDVDYTNKEIVKALQDVVDTWNDTAPRTIAHSYATFPYRKRWSEGAMGLLLERKGRQMYRNHLSYSAGGVSVDDTSRYQVYMQDGERMWARFLAWMGAEKRRIDIENAFGSTG